MRHVLAIALVAAVTGAAEAQTQQLPPAQMPPSPKSITAPKPPVAPTVPRVATPASSDNADQLALMRTAQEAQANLRSLMLSFPEAGAARPVIRGATSNPCERNSLGAYLSCIDGIKRKLSRARLPAAEKSQLDADLALLRDTLKDAQYGSPKQRTARLAEARQRADRIDLTLTKLTEPRAPATAGLPLDKLIPKIGD